MGPGMKTAERKQGPKVTESEYQCTMYIDMGRSLSVGQFNDPNTKEKVVTGDFFHARFESPIMRVDNGNASDYVSDLYIGKTNPSDNQNYVYWKPSGANYYKEFGSYEANTQLAGKSSAFRVVEGQMLSVGMPNDPNTFQKTVRSDFIQILTDGTQPQWRVDNNWVSGFYIDKASSKLYYKVTGGDYYTESNSTAFTFSPSSGNTGVRQGQSMGPTIMQIFPNPAMSEANIVFNVPHSNGVSVRVWDGAGNQIAAPVVDQSMPGDHQVRMNTAGLMSGTYYVQIHDKQGHNQTVPFKVEH